MRRRVLSLLVSRDDAVVQSYFGIEHEGALWLVTAWLIDRASGEATPERMIRVDMRGVQEMGPDSPFDYVNVLLPKAVIEGLSQETPGYEVRSLPALPVVRRSDLYPLPDLFAARTSPAQDPTP